MINIIDSVLTPPLGLLTTATEADLTGTFAIIAGTNPDPRLLGALGETSDWTLYVFHDGITLIFMETRLNIFHSFVTNTTKLQYLNVPLQQLYELEEYACVHGEVAYSSLLTDGKTFQTVIGRDVAITVRNGSIYVNAAKVVDPDYLLSNGVLHILDRYLAFSSLVLMSLIIDVGDHSGLDPNNTSGPPSPILSSTPTSAITPCSILAAFEPKYRRGSRYRNWCRPRRTCDNCIGLVFHPYTKSGSDATSRKKRGSIRFETATRW